MDVPRTATPVDDVADRFLADNAALDPLYAVEHGIAGHDDALPALTPDWYEQVSQLRRTTLRALAHTKPVDATDRITVAALTDKLEGLEAIRAMGGADEARLDPIASPIQTIRESLDNNPTATVADWVIVASRLAAVPTAIDGYLESLRFAAARGHCVPQRQIRAGVVQAKDNIGPDGFFATFARDAEANEPLPESLHADLVRNADAAGEAYAQLTRFLETELLPRAPERDAVGRDAYTVYLRSNLGTRVDLEDSYAWGQDEVARIAAEMAQTAGRIASGASVDEAMALASADPDRQIEGADALQGWLQHKADEAIDALTGTHFDIPEPIRRIECRIAPSHGGGVYYNGPSEDLISKPGRMWWSVPKGVTRYTTWHELSTVYHEGAPGHHLQIAQAVHRRDRLNRWRRMGSWFDGHGEGWALYAERLMAELGFLDDPADYLGMLDSQSFRAARVVIDIGVHCDLPAPAEVGGGAWTYDKAWQYLGAHYRMAEPIRRFELDRYLGWPGQAPAYKIGERFWLQLRADAHERAGSNFDLKAFHRRALDLGSLGLDVLRDAVLGED